MQSSMRTILFGSSLSIIINRNDDIITIIIDNTPFWFIVEYYYRLRSDAGVSVSSTKGKLNILQV